ncbi:hypothetical protein AB1388_27660, partial [Streptomyces hydrogenans]
MTVEGEASVEVSERTATTLEERWSQFFRWGPYVLLGIATVLAGATASELMSGPETVAAGGLVAAALALQ